MIKHKFAYVFLMVAILALFVYGCCSSSKDNVFVNPRSDAVVISRKTQTNASGTLPIITFPSGAIFVGAEENTLKPDTEVSIIEQETTSQNLAYFSDYFSSNQFIYKINVNSTGGKAGQTTIEKPIRVTLPTNNASGVCYLAVKESDIAPWRYRKIDSLNDKAEFDIYKVGSAFGLVVYNEKNKNKLPATVVNSFVASSTDSIEVKDGKYTENLQIKGFMEGLNLGNINPAELVVRVSYRNNSSQASPIKVNGTVLSQTDKAEKTVPGYTYSHSFSTLFVLILNSIPPIIIGK